MKSFSWLAAVLLLLPGSIIGLPSFPGAKGFGAVASGGRGGDVYHVTKLADDGSEGTLRHGIVSADGPRTIVFDVGGNMELSSNLFIRGSDITIAGQTAPGGGVTLYGYPLEIKGENIIIRYLRIRCGDFNAVDMDGKPGKGNKDLKGSAGDSINIVDAFKIMIDHVSISWSMDEAYGPTKSRALTLQHSIISEALFHSYHWVSSSNKTAPMGHSRAVFLRGQNSDEEMAAKSNGYSVIGNLMAHSNMRMPVIGGEQHPLPGKGPRGANIEFGNNIVYNWGERSGHTATNARVNMNYINNYLIAGPSTADGPPGKSNNLNTMMRIEEAADDIDQFFLYHSGNYMDTNRNSKLDGSLVGDEVFIGFDAFERLAAPHGFQTAPSPSLLSAEDAYDVVLATAGASLVRDSIDARIVNSVLDGSGRIIDSQEEVGGIQPLASGVPLPDFDQDGMPDQWELGKGLDPNEPSDRNGTGLSPEGYTNLEVYLHEITTPAAVPLALTDVALREGQVVLAWTSSQGRVYAVEGRDDPSIILGPVLDS